jgi:hypothetical protein
LISAALVCVLLFLPSMKRLLAAFAISLAGTLAACSAPDPSAPVRVGPSMGGGLVDSGVDPMLPPADSGVDLQADASAAADTSVAMPDSASDVMDAPSGPAVLSFTLIDTSVTNVIQGSPVAGYDPIAPNSTFSLGTVGTQLSVRANLNVTTIGSVGFVYDATNHTENATPYVLCGDDGAGTIANCNLAAGVHTITATPYELANLGGTAGVPHTVTFTITP